MDPLKVLPPEVVVCVCLLLSPGERARLAELSSGWRAFIRDPSPLWRGVTVDMAVEADDADNVRVLLRAPRVDCVTLRSPAPPAVWRALRSGVQVPKLKNMVCPGSLPAEEYDSPEFCHPSARVHVCSALRKIVADAGLVELDLCIQVSCLGVLARLTALRRLTLTLRQVHRPHNLRRHTPCRRRPRLELPPRLEELQLFGAANDHVEVDLAGMRHLRFVAIHCGESGLLLDFLLPAITEDVVLIRARRRHLDQVRSQNLKVLVLMEYLGEAGDKPLATSMPSMTLWVVRTREPALLAALRALAASVLVLQLDCDSEPVAEMYFEDLGCKLRACGLGALTTVHLKRHHKPHDVELCRAQLREVHWALQGVRVDCSVCRQRP